MYSEYPCLSSLSVKEYNKLEVNPPSTLLTGKDSADSMMNPSLTKEEWAELVPLGRGASPTVCTVQSSVHCSAALLTKNVGLSAVSLLCCCLVRI